ncbi:MAG: hypothetical protein RH917_09230 [Lacipirellulaceae bacterium]
MANELSSENPTSFPNARYRAPEASGQYFCLPEWSLLPEIAQSNRDLFSKSSQQLFGLELNLLRTRARRECLQAAALHTRAYADVADPDAEATLIVTGHQPALVHPGVWLKSFAASQLAEAAGSLALNLVIDSDLCPAPSIRVPTGTIDQPRIEYVPWDKATELIPFEEREVTEATLWNSFPDRTMETIAPFVEEPIVSTWWPRLPASSDSRNVGTLVSQARHRMELDWGLQILDLPQSAVCQTEVFRTFFVRLIENLPVFTEAYNGALTDYRRAHRLRNHAQPLPNLQREGDWLECPFWVWSRDDPQRRPLFACQQEDGWQLTDQRGWAEMLPSSEEGDFSLSLEALQRWETVGVKLRSRALTTTLFARWFLADLFLHGIGGGKYDQVTDEIARRLSEAEAPQYAVLSGTLHLPVDHPAVSEVELREQRKFLRDIEFHGETLIDPRELSDDQRANFMQAQKQKLAAIDSSVTFNSPRERHFEISDANRTFENLLAEQRRRAERELGEMRKQHQANRTLDSREYAFCLFPREDLRKFLLDFRTSIS